MNHHKVVEQDQRLNRANAAVTSNDQTRYTFIPLPADVGLDEAAVAVLVGVAVASTEPPSVRVIT
jgi:hypothetical protein